MQTQGAILAQCIFVLLHCLFFLNKNKHLNQLRKLADLVSALLLLLNSSFLQVGKKPQLL